MADTANKVLFGLSNVHVAKLTAEGTWDTTLHKIYYRE